MAVVTLAPVPSLRIIFMALALAEKNLGASTSPTFTIDIEPSRTTTATADARLAHPTTDMHHLSLAYPHTLHCMPNWLRKKITKTCYIKGSPSWTSRVLWGHLGVAQLDIQIRVF